MQAGVVIRGDPKPDQLALAPGLATVHAGVDAAGHGDLARVTELLRIPGPAPVRLVVQRIDADARAVYHRGFCRQLGLIVPLPTLAGGILTAVGFEFSRGIAFSHGSGYSSSSGACCRAFAAS